MPSEDPRPASPRSGRTAAEHGLERIARPPATAPPPDAGSSGRPPFPVGGAASPQLLREEPLDIQVQGELYAVVIRTPGEEVAHAAGFALAEGIVARPDDLERIVHRDVEASDVVDLTLTARRHARIGPLLAGRGARAGRGSGARWLQDVLRRVDPLESVASIPFSGIAECVQALCDRQSLRRATESSHACAIYAADLRLIALGEDVGRHNAADKAVGQLFLRDELSRALVMLVSSRISYELVVKAARARIPIILALSHPTAAAVELGAKLNMTLATIREGSQVSVYRGGHRIRDARQGPRPAPGTPARRRPEET